MSQDLLMRAKTKGMEIKNDEKVLIKISLKNGEFWEKEYNQRDKIQKVVDDFKEENNEEIPDEYISDWKHKNQSLNFDDELKTLLANEVPTLILNHEEENKIPIRIGEEENIPELVGKPFIYPFEVFVFNKKDKILKIQKYDLETIEKENLDDYGSSSAYCNGKNYLFISGGEKNNMEIVDKLWKINLKNQEIEKFNMKPKKNHSMIFIPDNYVFIVGGNDVKTFYFDIEKGKIINWADLNKKRIEPSLILISDYLYCFDNINSKNNNDEFTFEKTDITSENGKWENIIPNLDSLRNQKMNQKFFAVTKDSEENILFLGGNMDDEENDESQKKYNYKYNMNDNKIENSDLEFKEYNFKEKTFLPYNNNIDYILPDFNRHHPEIIFFRKKENNLRVVKYEPKKEKKDNEEEEEKGKDTQILLRNKKRILKNFKYNFNMPSIMDNKENQNKSKNNNEDDQNIYNSDSENEKEKEKENIPQNNSFEKENPDRVDENNISISKSSRKKDEEENNIKIDDKSSEKNSVKNSLSPNLKIPGIENDGKIEGEIKINGPQINIDPPKLQLNNDLNINGNLDNKIDNKIDIGIDNKILDSNNIDIHLPSVQGGSIKLDDDINKINNPNLNVKLPELDEKIKIKPTGNYFFESGIIKKGKISYDKIKPNLNLNKANIDIKGPNLNADIKGPNLNTDIKGPNLNTDIKGPNLNTDIKGPNLDTNIKGPDFDIKNDLKIKDPNLNMPSGNINLKGPNAKIEGGDINLKNGIFMEGIIKGIKGAKGSLPSAKVNLNEPKINSPDLNINAEMPNVNIQPPDAKLKLIKDEDLSGIIEGKNKIDINAPKVNANVNLKNGKHKQTDSYMSGTIQGIQNINIRTSNINAPNINIDGKSPRFDINPGDINLKKDININGPDINLKKDININGPDINLKKDINIKGNIPGISSNVEMPSGSINAPKIDANLPGLNIKGPKIEGKEADFKINGPKLNGKIEGIDASGNFKLIGIIPGKKNLNIKGNLPDVNLNAPKLDVKGNMPDVNLNAPKLDLKGSNQYVNLNAPKIDVKGNISDIDFNAPKIDLKGSKPYVNLNAPKVEVKGNMPDFDINAPKVDVKGNMPDFNINAPKVDVKGNMPDFDIKAQKVDIKGNMPDFNINGPKINSNGINGNINMKGINDELSGTIEGTKVKGTKIDLPSGNINLKGPEIEGPNADFNIKGNGIKNSKYDFYLSGIIPSKNNKNEKIISENYQAGMSGIKVSANVPKVELHNEDLKINKNFHGNINNHLNPEFDAEIKGSRRMFNIESPNNNLNFHGNLNNKINLNSRLDGEIKGSRKMFNIDGGSNNLNIEMPKVDIKTSDNNLNILDSKNKIELGGGEYGTDLNIKNNFPNLNNDINVEMPKVNIKTSDNINILNSKNNKFEIGGGEYGADLNLKQDIPTNLEFNAYSGNGNFGVSDKAEIGMNQDINLGNFGINVNLGEKNDSKVLLNSGIKKRGKGLPMVGIKNSNFEASKVDTAGKFDANNIDVENLKSANVGVNGQKIGERIEE